MGNAGTAPGVIKKVPRLFITHEDVMVIFRCGRTSAYKIVEDVNKYAKKKGQHPFVAGKASKYLFSEMYGIPMEEVNRVINNE